MKRLRPQLHRLDRRAGFSFAEFTIAFFVMILLAVIISVASVAAVKAIKAEKQDPWLLPGQHLYRLLHDALLYADQLTIAPRELSVSGGGGQADVAYNKYSYYDLRSGYLQLSGSEVFERSVYEGARLTAQAECFPGDVPYVRLSVELNLDDENHSRVYYQEGYIYLEYCPDVEDLRRPADYGLDLLYFYYDDNN